MLPFHSHLDFRFGLLDCYYCISWQLSVYVIQLFVVRFSVTDWVWLAGFLYIDFLLPVGLNGLFALNSFSGFCSVYMAGLLSLYSLAVVIFWWLNCGHVIQWQLLVGIA